MSREAALGATLALLLCGPAASLDITATSDVCVKRSSSLRSYINRGAPWVALDFSERCAALPNLSSSQRAAAYFNVAGIRALVGDSAGAERNLKRAFKLEPGDVDIPLRLAQVLRDRPEEALRLAEQVAHSSATVTRRVYAHRLAGEIKLDLDDAGGARLSFERALELSGQDLDALCGMVRILRDRPQEASKYALRASSAAETAPLWYRPAAYRLSARAWLELKDYSQAMESVKRALDLNPDDRDTLRTMVEIEQERPRSSRTGWFKALWSGRRKQKIFSSKESEGTEAMLVRALASDPNDLETLRRLIALKRGRKDLPAAVSLADQFVEAIEESPDWQRPSAYRLAAQTWMDLGDMDKASQCILQAQGLDWQSLESALLAVQIETGESQRQLQQVLAQAYLSSAREQTTLGQSARAKENNRHAQIYLKQSQSPSP